MHVGLDCGPEVRASVVGTLDAGCVARVLYVNFLYELRSRIQGPAASTHKEPRGSHENIARLSVVASFAVLCNLDRRVELGSPCLVGLVLSYLL